MKQYILIAILLSIGTTQIVVTSSNVCACTLLANQNDCGNMPGCIWSVASCTLNKCSAYNNDQKSCLEASQYCQWNTNTTTCSSFQGCDTIAAPTSAQNCLQANLLCLAYNPNTTQCEQKNSISNTCSDYNDLNCDKNFGSDGFCQWNKANQSCNPINQCAQITSQTYCQQANLKNGITCQWNADNQVCNQITNCGFFTTEDSCRYYMSNLQSIQLNLCSWNVATTTCVATTNTRALTQNTCLKNTGYSYRWLSGVSDPTVGFCAPCSQLPLPQVTLISRSQCQCAQYVNQADCMTNNQCTWANNACAESTCNNVLTINSCITLPNCFWNYNKAAPGCETQTNGCASITYKINGISCAAQSLYCAGFTGAQCTSITTQGTCQSQTSLTGCESFVGSNGFCRWINNACVPLSSCSQITDAVYCSSWQNYCTWNGKQQTCNPLSCSSFTTQGTCTYVITGFQPSTQQLCRWNVQAGSCQNANSALLLTATNCVASSGNFYRWTSTNTTTGFCATCSAIQLSLQTNTSCSCQQFTTQDSCSQAGYCSYSTGTCQPSTCSQITNSLTCASLKTCYWSTSKLKSGCQPFTSCSALSANNQLECVQQSAQCRGFINGTAGTSATCSTAPIESCANIYATSLNVNCVNYIGTDGVCFLQKTGTTNTCIGFSQCSQATTENMCLQNKQSCTWVTTGTTSACQALTCGSFLNQQACTFYFPSLLSTQPVPCSWNSKTNTCGTVSEVLTQLTQQTCQANTFNSFRWITLSANSGYCVRCQQQIQSYNQCACSQLTTQNDCSATYDCYWNGGNCKQLGCNQIYLQSVCASQYNCSWTQNVCQPWSGNCQALNGTTQTQCISQNISCVGFANGYCNTTFSNCEYFVTPETCTDQKGANGICYWNNLTKQCLAGVTCQDLPETACRLRQKSCYWDTTCQPLTCEEEYAQFNTCTFVVELLSANRVQSCILNGTSCYNAFDSEALTQETCFANSNRTSRWTPLSKSKNGVGACTQCAKTMVPIQNLEVCQCTQYMTQEDCYASPLTCAWTSATNSCIQLSCDKIPTASQCAETFGCGYVSGTGCAAFTSCSSVTIADSANPILTCLSYSIKCRGYNGVNCTQTPTSKCAGFTPATATATNYCNDNIGTDGPCYYQQSTNTCLALTNCNQIINTKICGFYTNLCQVQYVGGGGTSCVQVTCSSFKSLGSCTYYITSFQTGAIQQCQWVSGVCQNLISSTVLTQDNCATNTAFTYRWATSQVGSNMVGYCTKCSINQLYSSGQCACNQILTLNECEQNQLCLWSTNTPGSCYNKPCNQILAQSACSTNPRCAWSQSNNLCQPFSGCADLSGINQYECGSYSVYCAGLIQPTQSKLSNGKYICQATSSTTCSTKTITTGTTTTEQCENRVVSSGICMMVAQKGATATCTQITQCSQINSQQRCESYIHSCQWIAETKTTPAACGPATCTNLPRQYCTYVLSSLNAPSSSTVTQCYWQDANNACVQVQNVVNTLTQENCYTNSFMMSRWSGATGGYCVSCTQYPITLSISSPCSCSTLSQYECAYASPKCVYSSNKCVEQTCSSITSQTSCSAVNSCIWGNNGTVTACMSFNSNCGAIVTPASPLTCLQSSINCPVFTLGVNGGNSTCSKKQSCSSYANSTACYSYNGQLAVPQCSWVESSNKCLEITNCGLINEIALCGLQTNRCQWSVVLNSCITQTCSSFTSPDTCNFIFTSYAPGDITLCSWNSYTNDCRSSPLESVISGYNNTNSTQCYSTTGHTYHQDGTSCVACYQSILAILSIVVLLIVL